MVLYRGLPYGLRRGMILAPQKEVILDNMRLFITGYPEDTARFFIAKDEVTLKQLL
jgi:hypothetical protein